MDGAEDAWHWPWNAEHRLGSKQTAALKLAETELGALARLRVHIRRA